MNYKVIFNTENLGEYEKIPGLMDVMQSELVRVYNIYVEQSNGGITEQLNEEFSRLNPNYFDNNKDKEWYDLTEYNQFMAEGYQRLIVDELNRAGISPLLDFFVDPEEVVFKGCLKVDHKVTIDFYLKQVECEGA